MHSSRMHTAHTSSHLRGDLYMAPPGSRHPLGTGTPQTRQSPWTRNPPDQASPGPGTPWTRHPPDKHSPGAGTPRTRQSSEPGTPQTRHPPDQAPPRSGTPGPGTRRAGNPKPDTPWEQAPPSPRTRHLLSDRHTPVNIFLPQTSFAGGKYPYLTILPILSVHVQNRMWFLQSVSDADKRAIVNKHNALRSNPKTTKKAKAMCKLVSRIKYFITKANKFCDRVMFSEASVSNSVSGVGGEGGGISVWCHFLPGCLVQCSF